MTTQPAAPDPAEEARRLRHDLRNALAPALLCADLLRDSADPSVARNAATIVAALERAMGLLKKRP